MYASPQLQAPFLCPAHASPEGSPCGRFRFRLENAAVPTAPDPGVRGYPWTARDGGGVEWDRPGDEWVWCGPAGLGWEWSGTAGVPSSHWLDVSSTQGDTWGMGKGNSYAEQGMEFEVYEEQEALIDPETGLNINL